MNRNRSAHTRVRLFDSNLAERFTLVSPAAFMAGWLPVLFGVAAMALRHQSVPAVGVRAATGLLVWTLFEYVAHRFLFHLQPRSRLGRRLIFLMHENHHADPSDRLRNIMPLGVSLALGALIGSVLWLARGWAGISLFLGFGTGYVLYDLTHYACHQLRMPGPFLGRLKQHHLRHHHAGQDANYAITAIFWDRLFGSFLVSNGRRPVPRHLEPAPVLRPDRPGA